MRGISVILLDVRRGLDGLKWTFDEALINLYEYKSLT